MKKLLDDELDKAVRGNLDMNVTIPTFLTPKRALELTVMVKKAVLFEINKAFQELESQGQVISMKNSNALSAIYKLNQSEVM